MAMSAISRVRKSKRIFYEQSKPVEAVGQLRAFTHPKTAVKMNQAQSNGLRRCFSPLLGLTRKLQLQPQAQDSCPSTPVSSPAPVFQRERRIMSLETGRLLFLSTEDLHNISTLWKKIPDKQLWAQRLFLKIFSLRSAMAKAMRYDGMGVKQLMQCERFQQHCNRFIDFWDQVIRTLSEDQKSQHKNGFRERLMSETDKNSITLTANAKIISQIRAIGKLHSSIPGVTFDAESWLVFKNVLLESVCGQRRDSLRCVDQDKGWVSWCKLVNFILSEMKDAFNEGIRSRSGTI